MNYHHLGKFLGPTDEEIKPAMAVRDLMSATLAVLKLSTDEIASERSDIALAYSRLGRLLNA